MAVMDGGNKRRGDGQCQMGQDGRRFRDLVAETWVYGLARILYCLYLHN